jgi:hypothetical protein
LKVRDVSHARIGAEISTQSIKNVKGNIIIGDWMIDECNLIGKGFHNLQISMNEAMSSLNQGKFFLELHGMGSGFTGIHVMKFFPSLMEFLELAMRGVMVGEVEARIALRINLS